MDKSFVTDAEGNTWQTPKRSGNGGGAGGGGNCVNVRSVEV